MFMNQKTLIIVIVAVVAVIIVVGLWLAGAAGSGPLAGTICDNCETGPTPPIQLRTFLTFSATQIVGCEDGLQGRWIQFSGTLKDINNNLLPNQGVLIYDSSGSNVVTSFTTDQNGAFSGQKAVNQCCPITYYAVFGGDAQYQGSRSTTASVPASNYCNQ
jgi:hypothetical protein